MAGLDDSEFDALLADLEEAAGARDAQNDADFASSRGQAAGITGLFTLELQGGLTEAFDALRVDAPADPAAGAVVDGRYRILRTLLEGALGDVYEVEHMMLAQTFALRTVHPLIGKRPELLDGFMRAAKAISLLGHENIVFLTDVGCDPTLGHYLVFEAPDGPTLHDLLERDGPLDVPRALELARGIGGALAAVYELGLVHGNVRPATIVASRRGQAWKLVDFGIAGALAGVDEAELIELERRAMPPTPYTDPAVVAGGAPSHRSDVFSLGCVLYEALTGRPPLSRPVERGASVEIPPLELLVPEVSQDFGRAVSRALSLEPASRFATVEAFLEALQADEGFVHTPTLAPIDLAEAARSLDLDAWFDQVRAPGEEPSLGERTSVASFLGDAPRSAAFHLDDLVGARPRVSVEFHTAARLRREYRRNLISGGLFVPCARPPAQLGEVEIALRYTPADAEVVARARVVSLGGAREGGLPGFGVALSGEERVRVADFLRGLRIGLDLSPHDLLEARRELASDSDLSAGEAFLVSRLSGQSLTVGQARALFGSLAFDFEEVLYAAIDKGFVAVVSSAADPAARPVAPVDVAPASQQRAPKADAPDHSGRIATLVDYFETRGSYMAAIEVLERAVQHGPQMAWAHARLAELQASFRGDFAAARSAITRARELAPHDPGFEKIEEAIEAQARQAAVRVVYDRPVAGEVGFIRHDVDERTMWVSVHNRAPAALSIQGIEYGRGVVRAVKQAAEPGAMTIVAANHPRIARLERAAATPRRQILLDSARRAGEYGPWFRRGKEAVAVSADGAHLVLEGAAVSRMSRGLYLVSTVGGASDLRLDEGQAESRGVSFSPEGQHVAWLGRAPAVAEWELRITDCGGRSSASLTCGAGAMFCWISNEQLALFDPGQGALLGVDLDGAIRWRIETGLERAAALTADPSGSTIAAWGSRHGSAAACWFDVAAGVMLGVVPLDQLPGAGCLREDGMLVAELRADGFVVIDFARNLDHRVDGHALDPACLRATPWQPGEPLVCRVDGDERIRLVAIDADALVH